MTSQERMSDSDEIRPVIKKYVNTKNATPSIKCIKPFFSKLHMEKIKNIIPNKKANTNTQSKKAEKEPFNITKGIAYSATPIPKGAIVSAGAITPQIRCRADGRR